MTETVTPMIHVPDVAATARWYESIGFAILATHDEEGETDWAEIGFGAGRFMLNAGGRASAERRREVDLYVQVDDVGAVHHRLAGRVEIVEALHDSFYGHSLFIVRDPNGFWITFAQIL